jgi:hypothetical protein
MGNFDRAAAVVVRDVLRATRSSNGHRSMECGIIPGAPPRTSRWRDAPPPMRTWRVVTVLVGSFIEVIQS